MELTKKLLIMLLISIVLIATGQAKPKQNKNKGTSDEDDEEVPIVDPSDLQPDEMRRCRGRYEAWNSWSTCTGSCNGRGFQNRERKCVAAAGSRCYPGDIPHCKGKCYKTRNCRTSSQCGDGGGGDNRNDPCAPGTRQGGWSEWSCWSQTCDTHGVRVRYRQCNEPYPVGPNMFCYGPQQESERCNGIPTPDPNTPTPCVAGTDTIFVVDSSGSIGTVNYDSMTNSLLTLISNFDLDYPGNQDPRKVRTGIVIFSNTADAVKELDDFNIPTGLQYIGGNTYTNLAINLAQEMFTSTGRGNRPQNPNVLVVLTDGQSTDRTSTLDAATQAKADGTKIIAVGIGSNYDLTELQNIASDPTSDVYTVNDFNQLQIELTRLFSCT